jgi:hypothetical protein
MCVRSSSTMHMRILTKNTLMSSAGPISMLVSKARTTNSQGTFHTLELDADYFLIWKLPTKRAL